MADGKIFVHLPFTQNSKNLTTHSDASIRCDVRPIVVLPESVACKTRDGCSRGKSRRTATSHDVRLGSKGFIDALAREGKCVPKQLHGDCLTYAQLIARASTQMRDIPDAGTVLGPLGLIVRRMLGAPRSRVYDVDGVKAQLKAGLGEPPTGDDCDEDKPVSIFGPARDLSVGRGGRAFSPISYSGSSSMSGRSGGAGSPAAPSSMGGSRYGGYYLRSGF